MCNLYSETTTTIEWQCIVVFLLLHSALYMGELQLRYQPLAFMFFWWRGWTFWICTAAIRQRLAKWPINSSCTLPKKSMPSFQCSLNLSFLVHLLHSVGSGILVLSFCTIHSKIVGTAILKLYVRSLKCFAEWFYLGQCFGVVMLIIYINVVDS